MQNAKETDPDGHLRNYKSSRCGHFNEKKIQDTPKMRVGKLSKFGFGGRVVATLENTTSPYCKVSACYGAENGEILVLKLP